MLSLTAISRDDGRRTRPAAFHGIADGAVFADVIAAHAASTAWIAARTPIGDRHGAWRHRVCRRGAGMPCRERAPRRRSTGVRSTPGNACRIMAARLAGAVPVTRLAEHHAEQRRPLQYESHVRDGDSGEVINAAAVRARQCGPRFSACSCSDRRNSHTNSPYRLHARRPIPSASAARRCRRDAPTSGVRSHQFTPRSRPA